MAGSHKKLETGCGPGTHRLTEGFPRSELCGLTTLLKLGDQRFLFRATANDHQNSYASNSEASGNRSLCFEDSAFESSSSITRSSQFFAMASSLTSR